MPQIRTGGLRALAIFSIDRIKDLPDVPTIAQAGAKPFDGGTTSGVFAPKGTPPAVIAILNRAAVAALKEENVIKRMKELGSVTRPTTPEQVSEQFKPDEERIAEIVKLGLLKPE
jgi:tripartite-type tricarboxylate transporter receptor subunit TctC